MVQVLKKYHNLINRAFETKIFPNMWGCIISKLNNQHNLDHTLHILRKHQVIRLFKRPIRFSLIQPQTLDSNKTNPALNLQILKHCGQSGASMKWRLNIQFSVTFSNSSVNLCLSLKYCTYSYKWIYKFIVHVFPSYLLCINSILASKSKGKQNYK